MNSRVIVGLFYFLLIKAWKSLIIQCEGCVNISNQTTPGLYASQLCSSSSEFRNPMIAATCPEQYYARIEVKQYPAIVSTKNGTSVLLACIFDFQFLSEAEIEVYWSIQLLLFKDSVKEITISSRNIPGSQSAWFTRDDGKYQLTGNLLKGVVFLEVKNLEPRDIGLYTCKVARLLPPPYLEGSSNGTYISGIEGTLQDSCKSSETKFVICLGILAAYTFVIILTTIIYVLVRRKSTCTSSPSPPSRDSMVYVDMNFAKQSIKSEK